MNKNVYLAGLIMFISSVVSAQDEGTIVKRERIDRSNNIFFAFGPSFTLGKNIGDYSVGLNLELGALKRVNRILSVGPSISYISFDYDPEKTKATNSTDLYTGTAGEINGWHDRYDQFGLPPNQTWQYGYLLNLEGGNISLLSLAVNLKINFIPITDHTRFSVYGFAKPFVSSARRGEVSGKGERYVYEAYEDTANEQLYFDTDDDTWYADGNLDQWGPTAFPALKKESKVSGGIFVGPGVEFMPAGKVSFFGQISFGYTFPISYVSTESFSKTVASYTDDKFPIVEKGFPSVTLQFGASVNF